MSRLWRVVMVGAAAIAGCASRPAPQASITEPEKTPVVSVTTTAQEDQTRDDLAGSVSDSAKLAEEKAQESVRLVHQWQPGSTIKYRMLLDLQGHTHVDKMTQHSSVVTTMEFTLAPTSVDEKGIARVKCTYGSVDSIRKTQTTERWTSLPLAKGEEDSIQCQALRAMVGVSFDFLIAPTGEIMAIEGSIVAHEEARKKVLGMDPYVESALRTMFHEFSPEFIRSNLVGALRCTPEDARTALAQTWESRTTRPSQAGTILVETTWRIDDIGTRAGDPVILVGETRMTLSAKGGFITAFYDSDITGSQGRARAEYDAALGLLRRFHRETNLTFKNTTLPDKDPVQYKSHTQDVTEVLALDVVEFIPASSSR